MRLSTGPLIGTMCGAVVELQSTQNSKASRWNRRERGDEVEALARDLFAASLRPSPRKSRPATMGKKKPRFLISGAQPGFGIRGKLKNKLGGRIKREGAFPAEGLGRTLSG